VIFNINECVKFHIMELVFKEKEENFEIQKEILCNVIES